MAPVIQYDGTNHRGEPSSPRVDLVQLRQLLDRAACMVEGQAYQLRAAPGLGAISPEARDPHRDLIRALRECRAVRVRRKRRTRIIAERGPRHPRRAGRRGASPGRETGHRP